MKTGRKNHDETPEVSPAVVYLWGFGLAIMSYVIARIVLDGQPHPYHWLSGLVAGPAGLAIGWLWFRWRGNVF